MSAFDENPIAAETVARDIAPPAELEAAVRARLRSAGLLSSRSWWRHGLAAAAVFALGLVAGRAGGESAAVTPADSRPRFLLLLYPGPGAAPSPVEEARSAAEYGAWASAERRSGRAMTGERLAEPAVAVELTSVRQSGDAALQGFFVVSARDVDDATQVAAASPHVRRGGRIVVRAIDTPR